MDEETHNKTLAQKHLEFEVLEEFKKYEIEHEENNLREIEEEFQEER